MKRTPQDDDGDSKSGLPKSLITSFTFPSKQQQQQPSTSARELRPRKSSSTPSPSKPKPSMERQQAKKPKLEHNKEEEKEKEVLRNLPDHIAQGVEVMICGINPGITSSRKQAHFAHHSNHFWRCLYMAGLTPSQLPPSQDYTLPDQQPPYLRIGLTNLCSRPSRDASMLKGEEYLAGIPRLLAKLHTVSDTCRLVNFVGKGIAQEFEKALKATERKSGAKLETRQVRVPCETPVWDQSNGLGLQSYAVAVPESERLILFFTVVSTSGRVTSHQLPQKAQLFKQMRLLAESLATPPEQRTGEKWKSVSVQILPEPEKVETKVEETEGDVKREEEDEGQASGEAGEEEVELKAEEG